MLRVILLFVFALVTATPVVSQEQDLSKLSPTELISKLASKNNAPPRAEPGKSDPKMPAGYSRAVQDEVYAAINELLGRDESCLDELIGSFNDQRYSVSEDYYGDGFFHYHVGQMCYWIFLYKLEPKYGIARSPELPNYFRTAVNDEKVDLQKWLMNRKDKSLAELQIETCGWFLQQKQPAEVEDEHWQRVTTGVQARLAALKSTGKAYQPKPYQPRKRW